MPWEQAVLLVLLATAGLLVAAILLGNWWHLRREARVARLRQDVETMLAAWAERRATASELTWLGRLSAADRRLLLIFLVKLQPTLDIVAAERARSALRDSGLLDREIRRLRSRSATRRADACRIFGRLGQADAVPLIAERLQDRDPAVRREAIGALAELRAVDTVDAVARAIDDGGDWNNLLAAMALVRMGPVSVPRIGALLASSTSPAMTKALLQVTGRLGAAADPGAVRALANHADAEVRVEALRAIGTLGPGSESVEVCLAAMDDPEWPPRALAAWSLGRLGDERAVPRLEQAMGDTGYWVRHHVAEALARLGPAGEAALRRGLSHTNPFVRDMAAQALYMQAMTAGEAA